MQSFNAEQFANEARAVQGHLAEMQARLAGVQATEQAGNGLVSVTADVHGRVLDVSVDPSLLDPSRRDHLESLLAEAFSNVNASVQQAAKEQMAPVTDVMARLTGIGNAGVDRLRDRR